MHMYEYPCSIHSHAFTGTLTCTSNFTVASFTGLFSYSVGSFLQLLLRLFDFPYYQLEKNNIPAALVTKYDGQWIKTSTQDYIDQSNRISRALLRLGIQKNDKIAVISSSNRTEWNIMDIGVLQVGAHFVFGNPQPNPQPNPPPNTKH